MESREDATERAPCLVQKLHAYSSAPVNSYCFILSVDCRTISAYRRGHGTTGARRWSARDLHLGWCIQGSSMMQEVSQNEIYP